MNLASFDLLCSLLSALEKQQNHLNEPVSLKRRITISLYALGSSAEYRTIANLFGVGTSTVCEIVLDFCFEVWRKLRNDYLNSYPLNDQVVTRNIKGFEEMGFPQCIGAIDGCHIEVKPHQEEATDYYNYKGWYSTILLAVVDHNYNFMYINVGCPGRCIDSTIFEQSLLKLHHINNSVLQENTKNIMSVEVPPLLIADSAFKLAKYMMKPFPYKVDVDNSEKLFNYRLSKCRRVVENAFGHIKARFRRIGKGLDNHIENTTLIIKACCLLHNFLNAQRDEVNLNWIRQQMVEEANRNRMQPDYVDPSLNPRNAVSIRNAISLYFNEVTASAVGGNDEVDDSADGNDDDGPIGDSAGVNERGVSGQWLDE